MPDTIHPVAQAFPRDSDGPTSWDAIQQNLARCFAMTVPAADDVEGMDFAALNAAVQPELIFCRDYPGIPFVFDPLSSASHNPPVSLKSLDDRRYLAAFVPQVFVNVIDHTMDTPPDSPANGDRYAIPAAPSGAWSDHAGELAVHADGDWYFVAVEEGFQTYSLAIESHIFLGASGTWEISGFEADSVGPRELKKPWGFSVVSETATPPGGTPAAGSLYIVGASATGAWDDHDGEVAEADGSGGWSFHAAYAGAQVFDIAANINKRFNADTGAWVSAAGVWIDHKRVETTGTGSQTAPSGSAVYSYSTSTPPTTSQRRRIDTATLSFTAKAANNLLRFRYDADHNGYVSGGTVGNAVSADQPSFVALYRDSEANAIAWRKLDSLGAINDGYTPQHISSVLEVTAPDAAAHTYTIAIHSGAIDGGGTDAARDITELTRRAFEVEEKAV
jgi:hypothetical protein